MLVDVPIIVVTVYQDREFCYRALEAGATDFLLSPVDHLEFQARARNLLTMRRQQLLLAERAADLERALHTTRADAPRQDALQRVLDAMPAAVSVVDAHGRLIQVNSAYERLLGIDRATALGRPSAGEPQRGICAPERRRTTTRCWRPGYRSAAHSTTR